MQYGYFDLEHKEYVITRPDTPAPWANYLGSPEYGAIVSNNGGGYSFVKSGANGRIIRYRFNSNIGLPGRYIYIRDNDAKDYWSCTWQPVGKPLDQYKTECHHGTAYTTIKSDYADIHSELTYYVPLNKTYEVWRTKITNNSDRYRNLSTFGFVEFTNENNYEQDQVNLQYTLFITRTSFEGNKIVQHINENSGKDENGSNWRERFFGVVGAPVSAYNGNLDSFIGSYRTYGNPVAVERGFCDNKLNYNSNACGALQSDIILAPGETKEIIYVVGQKNPKVADEILAAYNEPGKVDAEVKELIAYWHGQLNNFQIETPSDEFNNMVNVWNAYQCFITFIWSRAASFIYCGLRNGYGYRDTVQDIQGIIHINPELAAEKIRFMISAQITAADFHLLSSTTRQAMKLARTRTMRTLSTLRKQVTHAIEQTMLSGSSQQLISISVRAETRRSSMRLSYTQTAARIQFTSILRELSTSQWKDLVLIQCQQVFMLTGTTASDLARRVSQHSLHSSSTMQ